MESSKNHTVALSVSLIVLAIIAVGAYAYYAHSPVAMKEGEQAMMEEDAMMASTSDTMMKDEKMVGDEAMMSQKGTYETYSADKLVRAEKGHVVLFFRATWCPTCKSLDADIRAHEDSIPDGLSILDVNYDSSAALKKLYGVTTQHTFVEVDAKGTLIKKWTGSPTLAALSAEII